MRVLVVDDSNFTRNLFLKTLSELGVSELDEAANGIEAICKLDANNYALVTVDLIMPSSNGIDVIKHIKQTAPATKIVVCSSVSERGTVMEIVKLGVDEFILKPFSGEKVKSVLRAKLEECR